MGSWGFTGPTFKLASKGREVIRTVACVKNGKRDDVKMCGAFEQLLPVDPGNAVGRIEESATSKGAEDRVPYTMLDERIELCGNATPRFVRIKALLTRPTQVHSRSTQLIERENVVVGQPGIAETAAQRAVLWPANAHAGSSCV